MKPIIELHGGTLDDCRREKELIEKEIDHNPVFILDNSAIKLCDYIDILHEDCGLKNRVLYKLRICQSVPLRDVTWHSSAAGETLKLKSMRELLELLQPGEEASIIFESDRRKDLADVLQQLIYINYPITELIIKLRKEFKDAEKTRAFENNLAELNTQVNEALANLENLKKELDKDKRHVDAENVKIAIEAYNGIKEQIAKAADVELKVAVMASKKTGKSVLVNCMLGQELAPTSLEMATPNTCIYKKSKDNKYHLTYEDKTLVYSNATDLYREVQRKFRDAQKNQEEKYRIPDMTLEYVTTSNNFDSYTIYDTPGPDAKGADHFKSAEESLEKCDVGVFMIDYGKYLTTSEEDWLKTVKDIFARKGKFHTLLFTINQMDRALQDKGSKSRIKSIDFIRNRLREIAPEYEDCVIFATSALDYSCICDLKQASETNAALKYLFDTENNWAESLLEARDYIDPDDENLDTAITHLQTESQKLNSLLGIKPAGMKEMEVYSGIPQLLGYAKNVIQNKARDEIVGSITDTIKNLSERIQTVIDKSANLKALMGKSQEEIDKISHILKEYEESANYALLPKITAEDYHRLEEQETFFTANVNKCQSPFPLEFEKVLAQINADAVKPPDRLEIIKRFWDTSFIPRQTLKIIEARGKTLKDINILALTSREISQLGQYYLESLQRNAEGQNTENIDKLRAALKEILTHRMALVKFYSDKCRKKLEKENCDLSLPELPAWDMSLPNIQLPQVTINVHLDMFSLSGLFEKVGSMRQFFRNLFCSNKFGTHEYDIKKLSVSEIEEKLKPLHKEFTESLETSNLISVVAKMYDDVRLAVEATEKELLGVFILTNNAVKENIKIFTSVLDDRERFKNDLGRYKDSLNVIERINAASANFMKLWNEVSNPITNV